MLVASGDRAPLEHSLDVPLPKVKAVGEDEVFKVIKTGKSKKSMERMVAKVCYVGEGFTRKPPKYERHLKTPGSFGTLFTCCSDEVSR